MTLNSVVFPAPFGPMSPVTTPASARSVTPTSAATPPKWTLTWSTSRAGGPPAAAGPLPGSGGTSHLAVQEERSGFGRLVAEGQVHPARQPLHAQDAVGVSGEQHDPDAGGQSGEIGQ